MRHPIAFYFELVESHGVEIGLTLVVSGVVIVGVLTPRLRYRRWRDELFHRALLGKGQFRIPESEIPPISDSLRAEVVAEWERTNAEASATGSDPEEIETVVDYCCLRNAEIRAGMAMNWVTAPFLAITASSIDAVYPGVRARESMMGKSSPDMTLP
jgi:hypothetical protein